jgi:uncharacterized protein (TIGR02271 family)
MSDSNLLLRPDQMAERSKHIAMNTAWSAGHAWWEMMMGFQREWQRASLMALSSFGRSSANAAASHIASQLPRPTADFEVVGLGQEQLNVGTQTIQGETTRIRRRVVAHPVEKEVTLRDEKVTVERRPVTPGTSNAGVLSETVIEMSDSHQVPTVWKSMHVAEEMVLRKQVTEHVEKVREMVRRDVVDVEHSSSAQEVIIPEPIAEALLAAMPAVVENAVVEHKTPTFPAGKHPGEDSGFKKPSQELSPAAKKI